VEALRTEETATESARSYKNAMQRSKYVVGWCTPGSTVMSITTFRWPEGCEMSYPFDLIMFNLDETLIEIALKLPMP
jgi:hypothetical protein